MGAELWHHVSRPHDAPLDALREIQTRCLSTYDLPALIQECLDSARCAVEATERDDKHGLLDFYRSDLAKMEAIAADRIPQDIHARIELIRRIYDSSGQGIGNVLDVTDVCESGGMHITQPCDSTELSDLIGSDRPTLAESDQMVNPINAQLGRGDSVCFPVYSDDRTSLIAWCFVGNTVD